MPIKHKVESGVLFVERSGGISTQDEQAALDARTADPDVVPGIPVLVDCRQVEPADSTEVVRYLANQIASHAKQLKCGPVAIVVASEVEYGMARMYQILTESAHPKTEIFRNVEAARQWIVKGREGNSSSLN